MPFMDRGRRARSGGSVARKAVFETFRIIFADNPKVPDEAAVKGTEGGIQKV